MARSRVKKDNPYRSTLEQKVAVQLPKIEYETDKIKYIVPASKHSYTPDFKLPDGSYIEVKGRLQASERKKHLLIQEQHPEIEIKFYFDKSQNKLYKGSPTTYADWANKNGFLWTDTKRGLPKEWLTKVRQKKHTNEDS